VTHDSKYVVKTLSKSEVKFLISILKDYVHFLKLNRHTMLSRYVGLHSLRIYGLNKYFVVMENVFEGDLKPTEIYDLKGSWVNRSTNHELYSGSVMKDIDLKRPIILEERNTKRILQQLERDSTFLREHQIMDYSVLLGIYYLKLEFQGKNEDVVEEEVKDGMDDDHARPTHSATYSHSAQSQMSHISRELGGIRARIIDSPGIYYIGIIDTLQDYNWRKRLETWAKTCVKRNDGRGISSVEPGLYQQRFLNYLNHVLISQKQYKKALGIASMPFAIEKVYVYAAGHEVENGGGDTNDVQRPKSNTVNTMNYIRMQRSMKSPTALCRFAYCPASFHEEDDDAQSILGNEDANERDLEMVNLPFGPSPNALSPIASQDSHTADINGESQRKEFSFVE